MTNNEDTENAWWHVRSSHGVPGVVRMPDDASAHGAEQFCEDGAIENPHLQLGRLRPGQLALAKPGSTPG